MEPTIRPLQRIGIVGLGDQGTPIALRLLKAGWPLGFFARRPQVQARFTTEGATAMSLRELGGASDIVLIVVGDASQMREVLVAGGMLDAMRPGSVLIVHSSIAPEAVREIARLAAERGIYLLDAPVSGGRDRSYAGDLTLLVGGEEEVLDAVRPVLGAYGSHIVRMGPVGAGQLAKSLNNYFYAAHLATAAKMVELVRALGIDEAAAAQALPACSGSSAVLAMQAQRQFGRTRHDTGSAHAAALLCDVVDSLRASAARAGVELGLVDQLVEQGLAGERARAEEEAGELAAAQESAS